MKKIWIPASITTVAIGAFFVFQNAGVVSPKLGYWETVVDLSNVVVSPGASSGNVGTNQGNGYVGSGSTGSASSLVNKFTVNTSACEYRLRYKEAYNNTPGTGYGNTPGSGVGYNNGSPPQNGANFTTFASSYASQVRRTSNGNITMSFSADSFSPFKLYAGMGPSMNGGFPISYSISFNQNQTFPDKFNGQISVRSVGGWIGAIPIRLENGVSVVKLERRCYELPLAAADAIETTTK